MMATFENKRVLIMAGGTGGHVIPGLSVAEGLKQKGFEVQWLGTDAGIESSLVPDAGLKLNTISVNGLRGKGIAKLLLAPLMLIRSLFEAMSVVRRFNPVLVIGMGGFASGPGGLAAKLLGKKLVVHEQNAIAGSTNRILAKLADLVLTAFPAALKNQGGICVGNPVRNGIADLPASQVNVDNGLKILVLGGSLGALAINQTVPKAAAVLRDKEIKIEWRHQCGARHVETTKSLYQAQNLCVEPEAFIADMVTAYGWADLVVCRAGALTVSELAVAGRAAIFVPYPYAIDDHQTENARWLTEKNAGLLLPQEQMTVESLVALISELYSNPEQISQMAKQAKILSVKGSTDQIINKCLELIA